MEPACEVDEKDTREKNDGNEGLSLDDNEKIEADSEAESFVEEDWNDPEQDEVPKRTEPELSITAGTRSGNRKRTGMRYNRYGDDFLIDKIRPEELGDELLSVGELVADDEWQIINDSEHYPMEDYVTPEQETDLEQSEIEMMENTNLRILEWMPDVKSKGCEGQSIQQVDVSAEQHVKKEDRLFGWTATDRPLEKPPDNLDPASSTKTSVNIFVRGVGVGHTHTENLMIKKLKEVRETKELELDEDEAEPTIRKNFKTKFEIPNEYSDNIMITDSDFILSDRTSAICITADMSFRSRLEAVNEGLEVWIPTESTSSLRGLETQPIRPLMDVVLPGYTPSSTPSGSQVSVSSSPLKELNEKLQLRNRESPARVHLPPTWMEQPIRSVVIASYKKNTEGRYHRQNRMDWNAAQQARRNCFHDATWAEYHTQPRVPEGAVHPMVGDSLLRALTRIQSYWQTGVLSFSGAAMMQILASLEMLGMARMYTVTLMKGTNDVSRGESRKVMRLHDKMSCILEELRIQMEPAILTVCTIPYNMKADQDAMEMNAKVRNLNEVIRQIHQRSVLSIGLLDVADQMERSFPEDASSDGIHFDRPRGVEWLNDVFQRRISALEAYLLEMAQFTFSPPPDPPFLATRTLSSRLGARVDSRDSSRSSWTRLPGSTPMEAEEAESPTPQSSVVS